MALLDKNIVITPNIGQSADPKIVFSGANANVSAQTITVTAYPTSNGTLSFDGSAGQLFSITNSLTGTIFSVNDISGIPSIEVIDTGLVKLAQYSGNVGIGLASPAYKLDVAGSINASGNLFISGYINTAGNVLSTGAIHNSLTVNGSETVTGLITTAGINSSANILATGGIFNALTVNGGITSTGFFNTSANMSAGGNLTVSNIIVSGAGQFSGPYNESTTVSGVYAGNLNLSPRVGFFNGTASQNWQIDNNFGSFRWYTPGVVRMSIDTNGQLNVPGYINTAGNVLSAGAIHNSLTVNGSETVTGLITTAGINSSANILATGGIFNALTVNGNESVTGFLNVTGNILATGGIFNALTVNGNESVTGFLNVTGNILATVAEVGSVEAAGVVYANSSAATSSTSTGALIVPNGGLGLGGNLYAGGYLFASPSGGNGGTGTATQIGVVPAYQYYALNANVVMPSGTGDMRLFSTNVFVAGSTTYEFECRFDIYKNLSAAAGTGGALQFNLGTNITGAASFHRINYQFVSANVTTAAVFGGTVVSSTASAVTHGFANVATNVAISATTASSASQHYWATIKGILIINTAGWISPRVAYTVAPGGVVYVQQGSCMKIAAIGYGAASSSNVSIGTWAA
jgi:hypothetical protein